MNMQDSADSECQGTKTNGDRPGPVRGRKSDLVKILAFTVLAMVVVYLLTQTPADIFQAREKAMRRICQRNIATLGTAYTQYLKDATNGHSIRSIAELVPTYIERELTCPRGAWSPYIISTNTVICPVVSEHPDHTLR